jgi:3-oxoacyl-[acyl-carrier-protein] synthase II
MGIISPIGIGADAFWSALCQGRSGIRPTATLDGRQPPRAIGGEVGDFDPKKYVSQRKSLKVMNRDIQLGVAAAEMACKDGGLRAGAVDPERMGVIFGADMMLCALDEMIAAYRGCIVDGRFQFSRWGPAAMSDLFPLWMLKYLPNMPACHIAIGQDARGPNNSLTLAEVSSLAAIGEAVRVIQRGQADMMIAGGTGSRLHPTHWVRRKIYEVSARLDEPAGACRPFDADRDGTVLGEGAAAFLLETRQHALARGATILAGVLGHASAFEPCPNGATRSGESIAKAIEQALGEATLEPAGVGHVNAHGVGTLLDDRIEAQAIHRTLGAVPVTAPKSYFGNLGAGTGAVELAVSVLACRHRAVPPTLNYRRPDPECPVNVVRDGPLPTDSPVAMVLNHVRGGRAVALVIGGD